MVNLINLIINSRFCLYAMCLSLKCCNLYYLYFSLFAELIHKMFLYKVFKQQQPHLYQVVNTFPRVQLFLIFLILPY